MVGRARRARGVYARGTREFTGSRPIAIRAAGVRPGRSLEEALDARMVRGDPLGTVDGALGHTAPAPATASTSPIATAGPAFRRPAPVGPITRSGTTLRLASRSVLVLARLAVGIDVLPHDVARRIDLNNMIGP